MSPRNGRPPSDNPKSHRKSYRLSETDMKKLRICVSKTKMTETEVIRTGIDLVYCQVTNEKE